MEDGAQNGCGDAAAKDAEAILTAPIRLEIAKPQSSTSTAWVRHEDTEQSAA